MKQMSLRKFAIAASAFACAALLSFSWSGQSGISLSVDKAQAATRLVVRPYYRGHYVTAADLPWYAVRAYYFGGPWTYRYSGWADYASGNGIVCEPGTLVKGGDGIMYVCQ